MTETTAIFVPEIIRGLHETDTVRMSAIGAHKIATSTRKNYISQWKQFESWAADRHVSALPAAPEHVAAYLAERSDRDGLKPSTLRMISAAVKFAHLEAELDNPCDSKDVRTILNGVTRMKGGAQKQAAGLTEIEFNAIRQTCRFHSTPQQGRPFGEQGNRKCTGRDGHSDHRTDERRSVAGVRGGGTGVVGRQAGGRWHRQASDKRLEVRPGRHRRGGFHIGADDGEP